MSAGGVHLVSSCTLHPGISGRATVPACNGDCRFFIGANFQSKFPRFGPRRVALICGASPSNHRRNPDFSRQQRGSSRGRSKQYQERDYSESIDESDLLSSKNGPLLSFTSSPRYQATSAPGKREKEIVELFRRVQAQLRERSAVKEEKKFEPTRVQGERGTVDSLLKLLRKHSVDQRRRGTGEKEHNVDQAERSHDFEDDQNSSTFGPNNNIQEELNEPDAASFRRPASNFRRRSPVPRVKFQPVFSADESVDANAKSKKSRDKKTATYEPESVLQAENESLDDSDDAILDDQSDDDSADMILDDQSEDSGNVILDDQPEDSGEVILDDQSDVSDAVSHEEIVEPSPESPDIGSLKLTELRELAKSRGIRGYSKMKKSELVELLSNAA